MADLVQRLRSDRGTIQVLGKPPHAPGHSVPGADIGRVCGLGHWLTCMWHIGYMPQELALIQEFTVQETFSFFGRCRYDDCISEI